MALRSRAPSLHGCWRAADTWALQWPPPFPSPPRATAGEAVLRDRRWQREQLIFVDNIKGLTHHSVVQIQATPLKTTICVHAIVLLPRSPSFVSKLRLPARYLTTGSWRRPSTRCCSNSDVSVCSTPSLSASPFSRRRSRVTVTCSLAAHWDRPPLPLNLSMRVCRSRISGDVGWARRARRRLGGVASARRRCARLWGFCLCPWSRAGQGRAC